MHAEYLLDRVRAAGVAAHDAINKVDAALAAHKEASHD